MLSLVVSSFVFLLLSFNSFAQESIPSMFPENLSSHQQAMLKKINFISIYTMVDGQSRIINYHAKDLCPGKPLEIEGYVSGVVVLCNDQVEAYLDKAVMSKIREERDGTLTCRYFGPLKSKGVLSPYLQSVSPKSPTVNVKTDTGAPQYLPGGYSYFPRVLGDGVSQQENFSILLSKGKDFLKIPVRQQGSRTVCEISGSRKKISFYFQGNSRRLAAVTDLQARLEAIAQGIQAVEKKFNLDLKTRVNLVDCSKICNAVTCEGDKEIWFYYKTLQEEPLAELKVIAEHEALHLLVNLLRITDNTDLLAHFADLKGFDTFSRERFLLITKGIILPENHEENKEDGKFFAFIDERNFLQGMKGGHSHQNPDEFCASFIHSLMYVDGLLNNLNRPLIMNGCRQPYCLTQIEKRGILKDYLNTLEILARAVAGRKKTGESFDKVNEVLEQIYFKAKGKQERCEIRKLIPQDGTTGFSPTCFTLLKPSD